MLPYIYWSTRLYIPCILRASYVWFFHCSYFFQFPFSSSVSNGNQKQKLSVKGPGCIMSYIYWSTRLSLPCILRDFTCLPSSFFKRLSFSQSCLPSQWASFVPVCSPVLAVTRVCTAWFISRPPRHCLLACVDFKYLRVRQGWNVCKMALSESTCRRGAGKKRLEYMASFTLFLVCLHLFLVFFP